MSRDGDGDGDGDRGAGVQGCRVDDGGHLRSADSLDDTAGTNKNRKHRRVSRSRNLTVDSRF